MNGVPAFLSARGASSPMMVQRPVRQTHHRVLVGQVHRQRGHVDTVGAQLFGGLLELVRLA